MSFFGSGKFWAFVLVAFLLLILYKEELEKNVQSSYVKYRMRMKGVSFSEIDHGFEHARIYADEVDMDDSQKNMNASSVRCLFFDQEDATRTGELIASWAFRTPFEAKFWGDTRLHTSDNERLRTDELRYFFSRREIFTHHPVTIWKDDTIITGTGLRYHTETREGTLGRDIVIRIWKSASSTPDVDDKDLTQKEAMLDGTVEELAVSEDDSELDQILAPLAFEGSLKGHVVPENFDDN